MPRTSETRQLTDRIAGQHLALAVAAHLARTQLMPDPFKVYDAEHMHDMVNIIAGALARTATLYVVDPMGGAPRELSPAELDGAVAMHSATVLSLKDGRALAGVTIRRGDLRQAIAILKSIGMRELAPHLPAPQQKAPAKAKPGEVTQDALMVRLADVESLLRPPLIAAQVDKAKAGALFIARHAPRGLVANLAMQLMSALHETRAADVTGDVPGGFRMTLARLRAALEETAAAPPAAPPSGG